ncbi:MAG: ribonuclease E [Acidobacteria bacterium]|nr:ribonuclease E [Acidobacteriota bacterium]
MQKYLVYLIYSIERHAWRAIGVALLVGVVAMFLGSSTLFERAYYKVVDNDPDRGAVPVEADKFGDTSTRIVYLDQGWTAADSLWFYNITQGSDLLPYDFFLCLEQANSMEPFRSPDNMSYYRYLPQKKTKSNPDALPVGMVLDTYQGKKYMGFTCAACHSAQVNYKGVGIRIDGGPGAADMDRFMQALEASLAKTQDDGAKKKRFVDAVLRAGNYKSEAEVNQDLDKHTLRMAAYNFFNKSETETDGQLFPVPYGYARLDAFGRIYNRVLEHLLNPEALTMVLKGSLTPAETSALIAKMQPVLNGNDRDHLMRKLMRELTDKQRDILRNKIFNPPNAPVSYPFLWDIPQHDYVQWNGIAANAGVGPIGRNTGEVIGVFGILDWAEKDGWTISSVIGGQGFGPKHISFQSSINVHNLRLIEDRLASLQSPQWTEAVEKAGLPKIDETKRERGEHLFDKHCVECHAEIDRSSKARRVIAKMTQLDEIGTDRTMANNSVDYKGFSGIQRNWYTKIGVGSVLLDTEAPVAALLTKATENVVATPDPDKWFVRRGFDWAVELVDSFFQNDIKPTVKSGNYLPDTTAAPFASLRAYKGRPLNGIWATAPYLHNGSVPTLYDLLLPAEKRPKQFRVGTRELDVEKVGVKQGDRDVPELLFDTTKPSNSNAGHEYATTILSDQDRWDLVEYLKSL